MPPTIHAHAQALAVSSVILSVIAVVAVVLYACRWVILRRPSSGLASLPRFVAFMSGLAVIEIATGCPLATLDHRWLTAHMLKHLLLMQVAAPLILFGTAGFAFSPMFWNLFKRQRLPISAKLSSLLAGPYGTLVFCWSFGTAAVIGWHIPRIFQIALSSPVWHGVQEASFILAGLLFWNPMLGHGMSLPGTSRWPLVVYLFLATVPCDILSAFLCFSGRIVYSQYAATTAATGLSPLQDQDWAGALMWVAITLVYAVPALMITIRNLSGNGVTEAEVSDLSCAGVAVDAEMRRTDLQITRKST